MIEYAACTHVGKRIKNEDSYYMPENGASLALIAVADGMGGHAAGKRASTLAIEGLVHTLHHAGEYFHEEPMARLKAAIRAANRVVYHHARTEEGCRGMGTTLALALMDERQYIAANIGDSRLYHLDGWRMTQVTQDHSLVAVLVEAGEITKEQAHTHPQRNIITRAVGTLAHEEADYYSRPWHRGDMLIASTDGLHGSVEHEMIEEYLRRELPLRHICEQLVERALENGATDNITIVLAKNVGGVTP